MKIYALLAEDWDKWVGEENDESKGDNSDGQSGEDDAEGGDDEGADDEAGGGENEYQEEEEAIDHDTNQYFNVSRFYG